MGHVGTVAKGQERSCGNGAHNRLSPRRGSPKTTPRGHCISRAISSQEQQAFVHREETSGSWRQPRQVHCWGAAAGRRFVLWLFRAVTFPSKRTRPPPPPPKASRGKWGFTQVVARKAKSPAEVKLPFKVPQPLITRKRCGRPLHRCSDAVPSFKNHPPRSKEGKRNGDKKRPGRSSHPAGSPSGQFTTIPPPCKFLAFLFDCVFIPRPTVHAFVMKTVVIHMKKRSSPPPGASYPLLITCWKLRGFN